MKDFRNRIPFLVVKIGKSWLWSLRRILLRIETDDYKQKKNMLPVDAWSWEILLCCLSKVGLGGIVFCLSDLLVIKAK